MKGRCPGPLDEGDVSVCFADPLEVASQLPLYRSFLLEAFERKFFKNLEKEVKRSFSFDEKLKGTGCDCI